MDFPRVYRCCQWLMCCKSMSDWPEAIGAVAGEVTDLPMDDETRVTIRALSKARHEELKTKEDGK